MCGKILIDVLQNYSGCYIHDSISYFSCSVFHVQISLIHSFNGFIIVHDRGVLYFSTITLLISVNIYYGSGILYVLPLCTTLQ